MLKLNVLILCRTGLDIFQNYNLGIMIFSLLKANIADN